MSQVFTLTIPVWEKILRTLVVYVGIAVLMRLAGKRGLAQLNTFDLVVMLLLSNVVQNAVIGNDNSLTGGLLGAAILVAVNYLVVRAAFMSPRFGKSLQGGSSTLYENGGFVDRTLRREAITREEIVAGLRREGLELDDVERIELEPEGFFNPTPRPKPTLDDVMAKLDAIESRLAQ